MTYQTTDYTSAIDLAKQQPKQYQQYDYSALINKANAAPIQHQNYDYGKSLGYADRTLQHNNYNYGQSLNLANRNTQLQGPQSVTSLGDVNSQIGKAANTLAAPQYQNSDYVGQLANSIYQGTAPIRQQQAAGVNQNYNQSGRNIAETLASKGLLRSGTYANQLTANEQNRNSALANIDTNALNNAYSQALNAGSLGLSERGQLTSQQQTAANQLASLLGQQTGEQQWANQFNANQNQQQFANTLASQQAQAAENQYGSNYAANQLQNQFANTLAAQNAQAGENQFGSNFSASEAQRAFNNLSTAMSKAADENRYGQQFNANQSQQDWQNQFNAGQLTGNYGGQQTLAAQQLAAQTGVNQQAQNQNLMQMLLNNRLNESQQTGYLPDLQNFNYGDVLSNLLNGTYSGAPAPATTSQMPAATSLAQGVSSTTGTNGNAASGNIATAASSGTGTGTGANSATFSAPTSFLGNLASTYGTNQTGMYDAYNQNIQNAIKNAVNQYGYSTVESQMPNIINAIRQDANSVKTTNPYMYSNTGQDYYGPLLDQAYWALGGYHKTSGQWEKGATPTSEADYAEQNPTNYAAIMNRFLAQQRQGGA